MFVVVYVYIYMLRLVKMVRPHTCLGGSQICCTNKLRSKAQHNTNKAVMLKQANDGISKVWKVHKSSDPFYSGGKVR